MKHSIVAVALAFILALLMANQPCIGAEEPELTAEQIAQRQKKLWKQAGDYLQQRDYGQAALYYNHFHKTYPDHDQAQEALWQAASLYLRLARTEPKVDYSKALSLLQKYIIAYPTSERVPTAYLAMADSYYASAQFRDANNYYTLFLEDYPKHPQRDRCRYRRAKARVRINKLQEAREDYALLSLSSKRISQLRGQAGLGHIYFARGEWHNALGILLRVQHHNPDYHIHDPEILEHLGIASIRVGSTKEGRRFLLHYLNITDPSKVDIAILFELAESFMADGKVETARRLYQRTIKLGREQQKEVILSHFRLAQFKAAKFDTMSKAQRQAFIARKGDNVFQTVLDDLYTDPVAQEARFALFERYLERQENDAALAMGKAYLRYQTSPAETATIRQELGKIMITMLEPLLAEGKYDQVRQLYVDEHVAISGYPHASLLTMIGSAYAAQGLYQQASVIYYRAMALEMNDQEKADLYRKRATTYLANNDVQAAQRLLKYLRQIYQQKKEISWVNWLSARLRLLQKRPADAINFLQMALEGKDEPEQRTIYAEDLLELLISHDLDRLQRLLASLKQQGWFPAEKIQHWYNRLGQAHLLQEQEKEAIQAFQQALAVDLPEDSPAAQTSHLLLGDLFSKQQRYSEALAHFNKASNGPTEETSQHAKLRLEQARLNSAMDQVQGILQ